MGKLKNKIAIVIGQANFGGVTISSAMIFEELKKLNYNVSFVISSNDIGNGENFLHDRKINPKLINLNVKKLKSRCINLKKILNEMHYVIYAESNEAQFVISSLKNDIKIIKFLRNPYEIIINRYAYFNMNYLDHLVSISPLLSEISYLKYPKECKLIPNATNFKFKSKDFGNGEISLLYVGRIDNYHKNTSILLKIANEIKIRGFKQKWFIAGDGPHKEDLLNGFKKNELEIDQKLCKISELENIFHKTDFVIIPSHFEAFGRTLIESMATGAVPICSNLSVFSWILGPNSDDLQVNNDYYKEYVDIIIDLYLNEDKYKKIQYVLKKRQENYYSTNVLNKNLSSILSLASDKKDFRNEKINIPFRERIKDTSYGKILHKIFMKLKNNDFI